VKDWKERLKKLQQENKEKEVVTESSFSIGTILYMVLDQNDGITPKYGYSDRKKYFIIIGFTPEGNAVGSLLINSDINPHVIRTEELISCQYPVKKADYPDVLEYNSYIDCSEIFEIRKEKIMTEGAVKGHLTEQDKELVINFLKETEVITTKEKKRYGIL
jgi:hypothetical protein